MRCLCTYHNRLIWRNLAALAHLSHPNPFVACDTGGRPLSKSLEKRERGGTPDGLRSHPGRGQPVTAAADAVQRPHFAGPCKLRINLSFISVSAAPSVGASKTANSVIGLVAAMSNQKATAKQGEIFHAGPYPCSRWGLAPGPFNHKFILRTCCNYG